MTYTNIVVDLNHDDTLDRHGLSYSLPLRFSFLIALAFLNVTMIIFTYHTYKKWGNIALERILIET